MKQPRFANMDRRGMTRAAFTFTEVLFAVMILGIGFIMVAAIFPVAIQQSQANRDDTTGVIVAKAGARVMQERRFSQDWLTAADRLDFRLTNKDAGRVVHKVYPFDNMPADFPKFFALIREELISKSDPRYAWVPLGYKVLPPVPSELYGLQHVTNQRALEDQVRSRLRSVGYEVYIVAVMCRTKAAYDLRDLNGYTFIPKRVAFALTEGVDSPDLLTFSSVNDSLVPAEEPAAAEGAYVLVADDQISPMDTRIGRLAGLANGRMYRLGAKRDDKGPGVWELLPGQDMAFTPARGPFPELNENLPPRPAGANVGGRPAIGFMIGRGLSDPQDPNSPRDGAAQDLFAMPTMVFFD